MIRLSKLALLLTCASCAAPPETVHVLTSDLVQDTTVAVEAWNAQLSRTCPALRLAVEHESPAYVTLGWGVYPGRETKGASYAYGAILINPTIKISNRPALIEHELGHAFGIGHSGSVDDIMHDPMTAARPSLADARRVCQHWGEP